MACFAESSGEMSFTIRSSIGDGIRVSTSFSDTINWHHYVAILTSDDTMKLYLDNELKNKLYYPYGEGNFYEGVDHVHLGQHVYSGTVHQRFNGYIDDL